MRVLEQLRSVAFIIIYLVAFQSLVLNVRITDALPIAGGIAMVITGLALFLEGLLRGLMPLGERVGVMLPMRYAAAVALGFGFLVGFGATLAEPAIAALRAVGAGITAWEAPLLFLILEKRPDALVLAIGIGVGVAVALGMARFYAGLSIKPFVVVIVPTLLAVSGWMSFDPNLSTLIGLAWDSGAVTTGAVTVPLVLALSIGVSRSVGKSDATFGGFGVIMLASAVPILSVCVLGIVLNRTVPQPVSEREFFDPVRRERALQLFDSEIALRRHAFVRGSEVGRLALFEDYGEYLETLRNLAADGEARRLLLGDMPLDEWLSQRASTVERGIVTRTHQAADVSAGGRDVSQSLAGRASQAVRAVLPLTILLGGTLVFVLRGRPDYGDEVILGVALVLVGFTLVGAGIEQGLARLGDEIGRQLPRAFQTEERYDQRIVIENFDVDLVFRSVSEDGEQRKHFYLRTANTLETVDFDPQQLDPDTGRYQHLVRRVPLFSPELTPLGIALVLLFAFGMGFGSTLAEPALDALGRTVEQLTVGTIKRNGVVSVVAVGVGLGLVVGMVRLLYAIPIIWLLVPPYLLVIPLTIWSEEQFAGVAWDCGGVTTGPVTVPLVMAMGLGIGEELSVVDGFGVLAMASVFPILAVLVYGLSVRGRQRRSIRPPDEDEHAG